jgi:hypothetical protein
MCEEHQLEHKATRRAASSTCAGNHKRPSHRATAEHMRTHRDLIAACFGIQRANLLRSQRPCAQLRGRHAEHLRRSNHTALQPGYELSPRQPFRDSTAIPIVHKTASASTTAAVKSSKAGPTSQLPHTYLAHPGHQRLRNGHRRHRGIHRYRQARANRIQRLQRQGHTAATARGPDQDSPGAAATADMTCRTSAWHAGGLAAPESTY